MHGRHVGSTDGRYCSLTGTSAIKRLDSDGKRTRAGGVLRVGQVGDIATLDPQVNAFFITENTSLGYDRLSAYDAQGKPTPMLAESWEMSDDASRIKLNLRKGVLFHTGREFTSDDVKYTFLRIKDPKVGLGQFAVQGKWFSGIDTPDKYTVVLTADQPRSAMFDLFEYLNIGDRETLEGADAKSKLVGTGPFTFVEWAPGDHITFARNPNYWQTGLPYLDTIQTALFRDPVAMVTAFEAGTLDLVRGAPLTDFSRLKANPRYQAILHPVANYQQFVVGAHVMTPPLDNKLVRQALNFAIDRNRFASGVLTGLGTAQDLPWSATYPMYEASKMTHYAFDLDRARGLLQQAGVGNATIDMFPYQPEPEALQFAQIYQNDLASIGVQINIVSLDAAAYAVQINSGAMKGLYLASATNLHLLPPSVFGISRAFNPDSNNEVFTDPIYSQLVGSIGSETDQSKLKLVYTQLNDFLLDQSFVMPISPTPLKMIGGAGVAGLTPHWHGGWLYTTASVAA